VIGARELADDRTDRRKRRTDLEPPEEDRKRRREAQSEECLRPRRAHRAEEEDALAGRHLQSDDRIDDDWKERESDAAQRALCGVIGEADTTVIEKARARAD